MTVAEIDFKTAIEDYVMNWVVSYKGRLRKTNNLNAFCRYKLAQNFKNGCPQFKDMDVHEIATEIDQLIPSAYHGYYGKRFVDIANVKNNVLIYAMETEENIKEQPLPVSIKKYVYREDKEKFQKTDWYDSYVQRCKEEGKSL
jgi:hypothetical protein